MRKAELVTTVTTITHHYRVNGNRYSATENVDEPGWRVVHQHEPRGSHGRTITESEVGVYDDMHLAVAAMEAYDVGRYGPWDDDFIAHDYGNEDFDFDAIERGEAPDDEEWLQR